MPLGQPVEPAIYFSTRQFPFSELFIAVRATDRAAALAAIREGLRAAAPQVPMAAARTWGERFAARTAEPRLLMSVLLFFGGLAALLAALGVYGLFSWSVALRTRELAIRLTLGARPRRSAGWCCGRARCSWPWPGRRHRPGAAGRERLDAGAVRRLAGRCAARRQRRPACCSPRRSSRACRRPSARCGSIRWKGSARSNPVNSPCAGPLKRGEASVGIEDALQLLQIARLRERQHQQHARLVRREVAREHRRQSLDAGSPTMRPPGTCEATTTGRPARRHRLARRHALRRSAGRRQSRQTPHRPASSSARRPSRPQSKPG